MPCPLHIHLQGRVVFFAMSHEVLLAISMAGRQVALKLAAFDDDRLRSPTIAAYRPEPTQQTSHSHFTADDELYSGLGLAFDDFTRIPQAPCLAAHSCDMLHVLPPSRPRLSHADWCLQSDGMPDPRLQGL